MNFLKSNYAKIFLGIILLTGAVLRIINVDMLMAFIGDQGWYYLSARDMILTGQIPLIGIPSSHPWLSQGAYWTYLLGPFLWVFNFDPVSGVYLTTIFDLLTIAVLYLTGRTFFSVRAGILMSVIYSLSPYAVKLAKFPYHTSPIPFFTILTIYFILSFVNGKKHYFPVIIFLLAVLYNFEIATFVISIAFVLILLLGYIQKQNFIKDVFNKKTITWSIVAFVIGMLPMLIYDFGNQFPQTLKFAAWVGYRALIAINVLPSNQLGVVSYQELLSFLYEHNGQLIFAFNNFLALILALCGFGYLIMNNKKKSISVILIINLILLAGFIVVKTPSQAYIPVMFPGIILSIAIFCDWAFGNKILKNIAIPFFGLILLFNLLYIIRLVYVVPYEDYPKRLKAAKEIIKAANGRQYNLSGKGPGSEHKSFMMNYEYLTWYLGKGPTDKVADLTIIVTEANNEITVTKELKSGR